MTTPVAPDEPEEVRRSRMPPLTSRRWTADCLAGVGHEMGDGPLTAGALARAAVELLPVDGAAIATVVGGLRLPLGASTAAAQEAEELETTLGDGPCLAAAQERAPRLADLSDLQQRWPLYGEALTRVTPYRSAAAIPLVTPKGKVFAALDFYAENPRLSRRLDLDEVAREIAPLLGALLDVCLEPVRRARDAVLPEWYADATARRLDVWVAMGIVAAGDEQVGPDALSLLRGYAYSHGRSLDDIAEDVVLDRLQVQRLMR